MKAPKQNITKQHKEKDEGIRKFVQNERVDEMNDDT